MTQAERQPGTADRTRAVAASGAGARDGGSSRSYHPNGWIAQAAARVAARAAAGSGCPGRLGLERLGRLAGRRSGVDGSGGPARMAQLTDDSRGSPNGHTCLVRVKVIAGRWVRAPDRSSIREGLAFHMRCWDTQLKVCSVLDAALRTECIGAHSLVPQLVDRRRGDARPASAARQSLFSLFTWRTCSRCSLLAASDPLSRSLSGTAGEYALPP